VLLFCLGMMGRIKRGDRSCGLVSGCRTATTCDDLCDFIRTPFWAFKYFMESLSSLLSNGSGLISISILSRLQSSFCYTDLFLSRVLRHLVLAQWAVYYVESNTDAS
jgi:hypothetical protein